MNERIEGLWWKARIGYNNQSCDPEVLEKFAELIVRECVKAIDTKDTYLVAVPCIKLIKEHFGVEE